MENSKNNLNEQEENKQNTGRNDNSTTGDDTLGENTEVTPLGEELNEEEENTAENPVNDGKPAKNPAPDDDAQLDIETVSP